MSEQRRTAEFDTQPMNDKATSIDDEQIMDASFRESQEHGGEVAARQPDGTNLYAPSYKELYALLDARGIAPHEVTIDYVSPADECPVF